MEHTELATGGELICGNWPDGLLRSLVTEKVSERFFEDVDRSGRGSCWFWRGSVNGAGYGLFSIAGVNRMAHRVSYCMEHGDIPPGHYVHHSCENRGCVNPDHLEMVTATEHNRIHGALRVRRNREYEDEMMADRRKRFARLVAKGKVRPVTH